MLLYLVSQIIKGALSYSEVIGVRPEWKVDVDAELIKRERGDLIVD
jgi:hypothetical protein